MIAVFRRYKWSDLVIGNKTKDISVRKDVYGLFELTIDNEVKLNCTMTEAKLIFASMSRFFGKRESKKLINVKREKSEKWE